MQCRRRLPFGTIACLQILKVRLAHHEACILTRVHAVQGCCARSWKGSHTGQQRAEDDGGEMWREAVLQNLACRPKPCCRTGEPTVKSIIASNLSFILWLMHGSVKEEPILVWNCYLYIGHCIFEWHGLQQCSEGVPCPCWLHCCSNDSSQARRVKARWPFLVKIRRLTDFQLALGMLTNDAELWGGVRQSHQLCSLCNAVKRYFKLLSDNSLLEGVLEEYINHAPAGVLG